MASIPNGAVGPAPAAHTAPVPAAPAPAPASTATPAGAHAATSTTAATTAEPANTVPRDESHLSDAAAKQAQKEREEKALLEQQQAEAQKAELEKKVAEEQHKLEGLEHNINDTRAELSDAVAKGDYAKANRLQGEMNGLMVQRNAVEQQFQSDLSTLHPPAPEAGQGAPVQGPAQVGAQRRSGPAMGPAGALAAAGALGALGMPAMAQGMGGMKGLGFPPNMMTGGPRNPAGVPATSSPVPPINLQGNDKKQAAFIDKYLKDHHSPMAAASKPGEPTAGQMMVHYGKENHVDPLILLSVAGQETNFGKTGIGARGALGVGAYDNDPHNATRNPTFSGVANQIRIGAETFAKLRAKGGSSENDSIAHQAAAVNHAGWATDQNWHNGVSAEYAQISKAANSFEEVA